MNHWRKYIFCVFAVIATPLAITTGLPIIQKRRNDVGSGNDNGPNITEYDYPVENLAVFSNVTGATTFLGRCSVSFTLNRRLLRTLS